jgi:hypothetical protein
MYSSHNSILAIVFSLSALSGTAHAQCSATKNLHGVWKGNDDGKYSIRVNGADVWWIGEGPGFKNVFKGVRKGRIVTGEWVDVVRPTGQSFNGGRLELELLGEGEFITAVRKKSASGDGFGASQWTKPCNDN